MTFNQRTKDEADFQVEDPEQASLPFGADPSADAQGAATSTPAPHLTEAPARRRRRTAVAPATDGWPGQIAE
jgi:hypothetical protein